MDGGGHHSNPVGPLEKLLELYSGQGFPTTVIQSTSRGKIEIPPRAKRLSPETKFELVRRYLTGESASVISKDLGIHRTTALSILQAAGVKRRCKVMTEGRTRRAITLYESGMSLAKIGSILKVNPQTIRNAIGKRGVRIRGAHEERSANK